jgi:lactate dehydrogenase-like 2-hydroxyacid dehydrogenase
MKSARPFSSRDDPGMKPTRQIALLGRIPPDIRVALEVEVSLLEADALSALDESVRAHISHGLTSAVGGVESDLLNILPGLKVIASVGAGTDIFDLADLQARGIALHTTADAMTEDTAECAVGLVFALLRNVVGNDQFLRRGDWTRARAPLGWRISARRVGIVGLGRIGGRVAEKLTALGCTVLYTGRDPKGVPWDFVPDVDSLAASVDVLILTCAGGSETRGLVDANVLNRLGPDGFVVNVSRGSVVDEGALIAALEEGRIAGAALDVFENEPEPNARFLDLSNCVLSPHAAVFTRENRHDLITGLRRLLGLGGG